MIRLRKYRIFAFVSVIAICAVYYYGRDADWESSYTLDQLKGYGSRFTGQGSLSPGKEYNPYDIRLPFSDKEAQLQDGFDDPATEKDTVLEAPALPVVPVHGVLSTTTSSSTSTSSTTSTSRSSTSTNKSSTTGSSSSSTNVAQEPPPLPIAATTSLTLASSSQKEGNPTSTAFIEAGRGRLEVAEPPKDNKVHWVKPTSQYPIPSESLLQLPTGVPQRIPRIQFEFTDETAAAQADRENKLAAVKNAMERTWSAYKKHAWLHDELRPVSAGYRDPFGGWAATLVDSLDTLWIMGMQEEFDEAVEATSEIDFTTCVRQDIPVFETVIRYLGGLLGAYDISGQRHSVLLDKASELAEVLMGAFDTPNHMPMTYYHWKPADIPQYHEAGTGVVMAELGSLSVEFTRLAQITKQPKYYDAIARITNEFEKYQNTSMLPGMWPTFIDASSGCEDWAASKSTQAKSPVDTLSGPITMGDGKAPSLLDEAVQSSGPASNLAAEEPLPDQRKDSSSFGSDGVDLNGDVLPQAKELYPQKDASSFGADSDVAVPGITKRQFAPTPAELSSETLATPEECVPLGFRESKHVFRGKYTLGGMADSTYEYLPKEYLLLGGFNDQYKSMYLSTVDTVREYLLYRPMIEDDVDILFTGSYTPINYNNETGRMNGWFEAATGHLSCFVGGMFGLGAKVFDRPEDLETAIKLTDACVWSYASTRTGIAQEDISPAVCDDMTSCVWNETKWFDQLVEEGSKIDWTFRNVLDDIEKANSASSIESATEGAVQSATLAHENGAAVLPGTDTTVQEQSQTSNAEIGADETLSMPGAPAMPASVKLDDFNKRKRQFEEAGAEAGAEARAGPVEIPSAETLVTEDEALPVERTASSDTLLTESDIPSDPIFSTEVEPPTAGQLGPGQTTALGGDDNLSLAGGAAASAAGFDGTSTSTTDDTVESSVPEILPTREEAIRQHVERQGLWPGIVAINHRKYILRPEAIESVFYMYRITGDESWRTKGWNMFQAVEKHTRTDIAYSAITDTTNESSPKMDEMESFWSAETLKYFFLLFSAPSVVSLDEYVLNTEAHPFLRPDAQVPEEVLLAKVEALKTLDEDYSQPHRQELDIFRADDTLA